MKKLALALLPILMIFTACDGVNLDIDDLPRTLRISVRTINNTDDTWSQTEDGALVVSSGNGSLNGTIGDVSVSPAQDSYVRSDAVTATASNPGAGLVFAFWMLPARSDELSDPLSTEGNIRFTDGTGTALDSISLRTDKSQSEIIGAFAKDGNTGKFTILDTAANYNISITGESSVTITISLHKAGAGDELIRDAKYRVFDETGEAITGWEDYVQDGEQTVASGGSLDLSVTIDGITDRSEVGNWSVAIIYEDPADDSVYVVK